MTIHGEPSIAGWKHWRPAIWRTSRFPKCRSRCVRCRRRMSSAGGRLSEERPLPAGKRAAFALFYGPLHYLLVRRLRKAAAGRDADGAVARRPGWHWRFRRRMGGNGRSAPRVLGIDRHPWALVEADHLPRIRTERGRSAPTRRPCSDIPGAHLAAFALNELPEASRDALLSRLSAVERRATACSSSSRLRALSHPVETAGGCDRVGGRTRRQWRFVSLPPIVAKLDRAAGLNHRELTARSLWLPSVMKQGCVSVLRLPLSTSRHRGKTSGFLSVISVADVEIETLLKTGVLRENGRANKIFTRRAL